MQLRSLSPNQLIPDPRNANVCSPEVLAKLKNNIARTDHYPALIVRPNPAEPESFFIIDGHHRKRVLEELGYPKIQCSVWNVSDTEAQVLLTTLNRLRGEDDLKKRAELLNSLCQSFDQDELLSLIPESREELKDILTLLKFEEDQLMEQVQKQLAQDEAELPVILNFMLLKEQAVFVEEILKRFQPKDSENPALGLVAICELAKAQG